MEDLKEYAEYTFRMNFPDKDGLSEKARLEQIQEQIGEEIPELVEPPFPEELNHYWLTFLELHSARGSGENGPDPISYTEILSWSALTKLEPSMRELTCIRTLDRLYLRCYNDYKSAMMAAK